MLNLMNHFFEPGEPPSRSLCWKPLGFLSHIKRSSNSDRFPLSLWEVWVYSTIGVPIPVLIGPSQQCGCNSFQHDSFGDHLQTCKVKSADSQAHDWVMYLLGDISRTGSSPPSSSYLNTGLHLDAYVIWQFTCSYYRSADKHKAFGWHTRAWWYSTGGG